MNRYLHKACTEVTTSQDSSTLAEGQPVGITPCETSTDSMRASDTESISSPKSQNTQSKSIVELFRNEHITELI